MEGTNAQRARRSPGRFVTWVLRSPFADLLDRSVMLMTVRGRRSGTTYTFPVQYAQENGTLWVFPAHHERKRWWRNLTSESPVTLSLRGHDVSAKARAFSGDTDPSIVEDGLRVYFSRFGSIGRRYGTVNKTGTLDQGRLGMAAKSSVIVRVEPTTRSSVPTLKKEQPKASLPGGILGVIRRHPLAAFYALTFLLSWGYWVPDAIAGGHWSHAPGLLGPMISAIVVTGLTKGSGGIRELLHRMFRWRVGLRWYLWLIAPLALAVAVASIASMGDASFPSFASWSEMGGFASIGGWTAIGLILVVNGYGEETGWRGFATPAFRRRHNQVTTSLLVSIPWALWHLPTFFIDSGYRDFPVLLLPGWLLGIFALAVVMTWLYEGARSSILIAALMHLSLNVATTTSASEGAVGAVVTMGVMFWSISIATKWRRQAREEVDLSDPINFN